jgi:hypothetical protein
MTTTRILIILLLIIINIDLFADEPRVRTSFKSSNNKFELKPISTISDKTVHYDTILNSRTNKKEVYSYSNCDDYKWGLFDKSRNSMVYSINKEWIATKSVIISDDGKYIVIIDDWGGLPFKDIEVLCFFENGTYKKGYTLGELVNNLKNTSSSVSHYKWCFNDFGIIDSLDNFELMTYELQIFHFDLRGNLIFKILSSYITPNTFYGFGRIINLGNGLYEINVEHKVYGYLPENRKIKFYTDKKCWNSDCFSRYEVVILTDGIYVEPKEFRINDISFNSIYGYD